MTAVITGLGVVSPYGVGVDVLMRGVCSGPHAEMLSFEESWPRRAEQPSTCMKIAESDVDAVLEGERRGFLNAESWLLLAAARLALADADHPEDDMEQTGIVVSTRHAGLQDYAELFWSGLGQRRGETDAGTGARRPKVSPARGPETGLNAPAAHLSIRLGASGPNMTLTGGAVGGIDALSYALGALEAGRARTMLVGGVEVIPRVSYGLRPEGGSGTSQAPRPFDRDRSGPLPGEAGVIAVLERDSYAKRRRARIRARLRSATSTFAPDGDLQRACTRSLQSALTASGLDAPQVGAVFAGANGSIGGDAAESQALHAVFGEATPVCAVKGATADSMGAAALVQVAVALASIEQRSIPPTAGFCERGEDIAPIRILAAPEPLEDAPVVVHAWDATSSAAVAVLDCREQDSDEGGSRVA